MRSPGAALVTNIFFEKSVKHLELKSDLRQTNSINLQVPYYRQHYDFTCGPASLMMAMKYFDKCLPLTKNLEIDIWKESNMVELCGTSRYGIAYSALTRGFKVKVINNAGKIDFVDQIVPSLKDINTDMLKLHFRERRDRCRRLGVEEGQEPITVKTIYNSLCSSHVPLK